MTVRIEEPNLYNTQKLLSQVLLPTALEGERVAFLCEPGTGSDVVARLRVMLTRRKRDLAQRGKRLKRFRLHSSIHPETHAGKRYDCVVMWRSVNELHIMTQELEDMLSNG